MNFCLADCAFHPNADLNASRLRTTVALYLITATAHPHHAHFAGQLRLRICAARSSEVCARFRFGFGRPHVAPRLSTSRKSRIGNCIRTGNCRSVRVGSTTALQRCRTARSRSYPAHGEATKSETSAQAPLSPNKTAKPCGKTSRCEVGRPCFGLSSGNAVSPETGLVNQVKSQNRRIDPHKSSTRSYGLIIATASSGQEICSRSCRTDISSLSRARNHHDQGED